MNHKNACFDTFAPFPPFWHSHLPIAQSIVQKQERGIWHVHRIKFVHIWLWTTRLKSWVTTRQQILACASNHIQYTYSPLTCQAEHITKTQHHYIAYSSHTASDLWNYNNGATDLMCGINIALTLATFRPLVSADPSCTTTNHHLCIYNDSYHVNEATPLKFVQFSAHRTYGGGIRGDYTEVWRES